MTITTTDALAYYASIKAALFPIPAGSKNPTGIVESFKRDFSPNPEQWATWQQANPGCNFGIVAFASRLIIVDIDTKIGRDAAWAVWCALCADWGIEPPNPQVQSARGGWHVYFAVPAEIDPASLRQPDAIKDVINVRCIGYTVAAGSHYDGLPYLLLSDAAPYPAPAALVEHCTRRPERKQSVTKAGTLEPDDVRALLQWMVERGGFDAYEDWVQIGMALKIEFGDAGLDLWSLTFDEDEQTPDLAAGKWDSFSGEPDANSITLLSFIKRANDKGWKGQIRKSLGSMFGGVAQIAANAGAQLPAPMPMMDGQAELARLAETPLADFMAATSDAPTNPPNDVPSLPDHLRSHALFDTMQETLRRVFALSTQEKFNSDRVIEPLAVLKQMEDIPHTFETVKRWFQASPRGKLTAKTLKQINQRAQRYQDDVLRNTTVMGDKWVRDAKAGKIETDNPDNVRFGLEYLELKVRWNAWIDRRQIIGGEWSKWTNIDDDIIDALLTRWAQSQTRFCPTDTFAWRTIRAICKENTEDPVLDELARLESKWDGVPRLASWLPRICGVPDDAYHQAVGKLIFEGIVARARNPGCKFDFMPVFYGPQGTGKSTLARLMALRLDWFTDSIMLGAEAKEMVLSLAGKLVVEFSEMGMRSNATIESVKAMITRQEDTGRTAYARTVSERKRRNIFVGTSNDETPLIDATGNRRFLPISVTRDIDLAAFIAEVGQLFGEAASVKYGDVIELPRAVWAIASGYQEGARAMSPLEETCRHWFDRDGSYFVYSHDLTHAFKLAGLGANVRPRVHMTRLGWRQAQVGRDRARVWIKHGNNDLAQCVRLIAVQSSQTSPVEMRATMNTTAVPAGLPPPPLPPVR